MYFQWRIDIWCLGNYLAMTLTSILVCDKQCLTFHCRVSVLFVRWDSLGGSGQSGVLLWVVKAPTSEHEPFTELHTAFTLRKANTHKFSTNSSFKITNTKFNRNSEWLQLIVHSRCILSLIELMTLTLLTTAELLEQEQSTAVLYSILYYTTIKS